MKPGRVQKVQTLAAARRSEPAAAERPSKKKNSQLDILLSELETYQAQLSAQNKELLETRDQLQESSARVEELYEYAPIGYVTVDRQGCIRELNQRAAVILGFSAGWLIGKPLLVLIGRKDFRRFLEYLTRSVHSPEKGSMDIELDRDGHSSRVRMTMEPIVHDGVMQHRLTFIDVTDIRKTERDLQESLENWHALVQNAPDVIMTLDRHGRIEFVSRACLGKAGRELISTKIFDHIPAHQWSLLRKCLQDVFARGLRQTCEISTAPAAGQIGEWYSFSFGPIQAGFREKGRRRATTLIIREISQQKVAEQTLKSASQQLRDFSAKLESVREDERTRVAREIHDELGQSLTALSLDLSWLAKKTPRKVAGLRDKMLAMIQDVDQIIKNVRRIAAELRPSILDDLGLVAAIEWQLKDFQARTGIRCRLQCDPQPPDLDRERSTAIFRIVQEALTNVARHASASRVHVRLAYDEDSLVMTVTDNGRGMPESKLTKSGSLGLLGMNERISRLSGELKIRSQSGKGTRLYVFLPFPGREKK